MAFLGVNSSITGRAWIGPDPRLVRQAEALQQQTDLPAVVCQILARNDIQATETKAYLSPTMRELMPNPRGLKDMEKATKRVLEAVTGLQKIAIFADYDVDGGASAALLLTWLRNFQADATLYIPDRIDEGYGPNETAMAQLAKKNDLIICVDCGTLSHGPISAAIGADVVVLDHHLGTEQLPDAFAIVNPNRQDENGTLTHLCAAAVVFLMLVEAGRQLRTVGENEPNLMNMLDLVGLATVADVAPLIGVNRAFVRQGLKILAQRERIGLVALSDLVGIDTAPTTYHLGYLLGPRINAGGRIGQADLGARLLATQDPHEADALAQRLNSLNVERREIEARVRAEALAQCEQRSTEEPLVWAAGKGWHPGVVGIVASRLKEITHRPSVVIGIEDGIGKGSGRSVSGIDLGAPIQRLVNEGLLLRGGGHKMAAGLTVSENKIEVAMARLSELLSKQGTNVFGPSDLRLEGLLVPNAATVELAEQIEDAGPFGAGAPAPRYAFPAMRINTARRVGENHLKINFGAPGGERLDGIAFGAFEGPIGSTLSEHGGAPFHLAGRLEINSFRGRRSVQLRLEDAAFA